MADETSPVIPQQHPSQQKLFNSSALNTAAVVVDQSPDDDHLLSDDDELSVGGTTPPPPSGGEFKDEQLDDKEDSVGPNLIKFSIDNILNPEFGVRMNAAESAAAAAVALHHHHQQLLIQQQNPHHQASPSAAAGFLGAFHQLPFLAAARQMILAAAASGSPLDYHHQQQSLLATQHPHSSANNLLLNHSSNTLNLVQSCTDKYLNSGHVIKGSGWGSHQPALPGGASGNKPLTQAGTKSGIKAQQVTTTSSKSAASPSLGKAIDLSVRNSASPPEYRQNNRSSAGVVGEKQQSTVPVRPQTSPSLASGSSNDDHSSAPSPTRSASVSGSTCSVGNAESGNGNGGKNATSGGGSGGENGGNNGAGKDLWPAWVYCTRYSDRPSSGPRARRIRSKKDRKAEEKRPRTAFTSEQLARLKTEFTENRYLTEKRRQDLARELQLHENQIKIWFQNKRAKIKKASGQKNPLALQLMAQGLYNHSTMALDEDEEDDDVDMLQNPE